MTTPNRTQPKKPAHWAKDMAESIVIAFILAFVFRAYAVEAFVIPTGSMAPTLLGQHSELMSPYSGYRFNVGNGRRIDRPVVDPMTGLQIPVPDKAHDAGDRILVLKYIWPILQPRRWDVVVFRNPVKPEMNYIKRLVGMPNEQLAIVRGNIYTAALDSDQWTIQRKTDQAQQAVWQKVYYSDYVPLPAPALDWHSPWQPDESQADQWDMQRDGGRTWHWQGAGQGRLSFDFQRNTPFDPTGFYAYDQRQEQVFGIEYLNDFRISLDLQPSTDQAGLSLVIANAWGRFAARRNADGSVQLTAMLHDGRHLQTKGTASPAQAGAHQRISFEHVDQRLRFTVDGQIIAQLDYNMTMDALFDLPSVEPKLILKVDGGAATVRHCNVDRDLHYTQVKGHGVALGTEHRPVRIGTGRYFVLGDNSAHSQDSRLWESVDPWVQAWYQHRHDQALTPGLVPAGLMIGKAFCVYFPATLPPRIPEQIGVPFLKNIGIVPDFSRMRVIR